MSLKNLTMAELRAKLRKGSYFSKENKRMFGDISHRILSKRNTDRKFLVTYSYCDSLKEKYFTIKEILIDGEGFDVSRFLKRNDSAFGGRFTNLEAVKQYIKNLE